MPKGKKNSAPVKKETEIELSDLSGDESPRKCNKENSFSKSATKRVCNFDTDAGDEFEQTNNSDFGGDMSKFVENLGSDMNKVLLAKRKRLEQYTAGAIKANQMKIKEMWQYQAETRKITNEDLYKNVSTLLSQWETDLSYFKEQEDKMLKIIHQQVKVTKEMRAAQAEKLETLRRIHEVFYKDFQEQETKHGEQCNHMQTELKKELLALQRKIMMKSQQEEMANMQKSLKSMLFM